MSKFSFKSVGAGSTEGLNKVDMSLDDIIRLNKKQKQVQTQKTKRSALVKGRLTQGRTRAGVQSKRGGGVAAGGVMNKRFGQSRKLPPTVNRRRGQGVITGLAARKNAALLKGISPLNRPAQIRPAQNRPKLNRQKANNPALNQRFQPFVQRRDVQRRQMQPRQMQRRPNRQMDSQIPRPQGSVSHRPFRLQRKWNVSPAQQTQREARQATFLLRRGLKVHAQVQKTKSAPPTRRTRTWRSPPNNSGLLTVSIDNPAAGTQPEHAQSWSLPSTSTRLSPQSKEESVRKVPKGVTLQFDINSVGKQTGMTLNERFRILKDQRVAAAHHSSKGGRFVTVA